MIPTFPGAKHQQFQEVADGRSSSNSHVPQVPQLLQLSSKICYLIIWYLILTFLPATITAGTG